MIKKVCPLKFIALLMLLFAPLIFSQDVKILYSVSMPKPSNHLFEVEINVQNVKSDSTLDFVLPVWRSGRYVIFNFASGVQEFSANSSTGKKLKWHKTDKSTWHVEASGENNVIVNYKVYANDFSIRTRGLNDEDAFIDPSAVFMYIEKYRRITLELKVIPYEGWHVTTGLDETGENTFTARDYDYFADCPVIIGTQKDFEFNVEGKKHIMSLTGNGNYNADTVIRDMTKIVKENSDFWGELPYESFTFFFRLTTQDYGGTEHINSFIINAPPLLFNNREKYYEFLSVCSHEFFHTWNVKRLRP
ncbi:MAG TPA: peptidase M61, partial [Ignavibacteria bacterium]